MCDLFTRRPLSGHPIRSVWAVARRAQPGLKVACPVHRPHNILGGTMRKRIRSLALTAATAWLAVGVAPAQAPQPPASSSAAKSITVTGCIQRAKRRRRGRLEPRARPVRWRMRRSSFSRTPWQAPAPRGPPCRHGGHGVRGHTGGQRYCLDADEAKLSPHVGHKVEITGTAAKRSWRWAELSRFRAETEGRFRKDGLGDLPVVRTCPSVSGRTWSSADLTDFDDVEAGWSRAFSTLPRNVSPTNSRLSCSVHASAPRYSPHTASRRDSRRDLRGLRPSAYWRSVSRYRA